MHIEKGLSLGYFQDIFLNVILSCTLCSEDIEWVSADNLNAPDAIADFHSLNPDKPGPVNKLVQLPQWAHTTHLGLLGSSTLKGKYCYICDYSFIPTL